MFCMMKPNLMVPTFPKLMILSSLCGHSASSSSSSSMLNSVVLMKGKVIESSGVLRLSSIDNYPAELSIRIDNYGVQWAMMFVR